MVGIWSLVVVALSVVGRKNCVATTIATTALFYFLVVLVSKTGVPGV
jgi:hypothetical protein